MNGISRGSPELHITTRAAKLNIRQNRPRMKIRHRRAQMQVRRRAPEFKINRSVINVKKNIMPAIRVSRKFKLAPMPGASKYIHNFDDDSAIINDIGYDTNQEQDVSSNPVDYMALDEMNDPVQVEQIQLDWQAGDLDINWSNNVMEIDWEMNTGPEIYVEPYDIQIYVQENEAINLKQKPYTLTGIKVDKKI